MIASDYTVSVTKIATAELFVVVWWCIRQHRKPDEDTDHREDCVIVREVRI